MPEKTLTQYLDAVCDEMSFLEFIGALAEDRASSVNGMAGDVWQNETIEDFFECAHAWAEASIDGLEAYKKPENPWKRCADILYMGKLYE